MGCKPGRFPPPNSSQHQAFRQKLTDELSAISPDRSAQTEFPASPDAPGHEHVGYVGTGDQEE